MSTSVFQTERRPPPGTPNILGLNPWASTTSGRRAWMAGEFETFASFARSLPGSINCPSGRPLVANDMIDFDMCWAFDLVDPWGNQYELNCYDYERVRTELVHPDGISPVRYWPREQYEAHSKN